MLEIFEDNCSVKLFGWLIMNNLDQQQIHAFD